MTQSIDLKGLVSYWSSRGSTDELRRIAAEVLANGHPETIASLVASVARGWTNSSAAERTSANVQWHAYAGYDVSEPQQYRTVEQLVEALRLAVDQRNSSAQEVDQLRELNASFQRDLEIARAVQQGAEQQVRYLLGILDQLRDTPDDPEAQAAADDALSYDGVPREARERLQRSLAS